MTLTDLVERYILENDLAALSRDYYRRIAGVYERWRGGIVYLSDFTVTEVNRFLLEKQDCGRSCYYRRSLRNGLRALLRAAGRLDGKLRPVKLEPLANEHWPPEDIGKLVLAVARLPKESKRRYWRTLIPATYYAGPSGCDMHQLTRDDIDERGIVHYRRKKTGVLVVTSIPMDLLAEIDEDRPLHGPLWALTTSQEAFRKMFAKIVGLAGLRGSFKKLRKSCGTEYENLFPGCGHIRLGNSRKVFEEFYWNKRAYKQPGLPPPIPRQSPERGDAD